VPGAHRGAVEFEVPAAFEDAVDDGGGEVRVVEDATPGVERLVGGEDHRALFQVALVHDVEEQVRRVVAAGQIAELVDEEDVRAHVLGECLAEPPGPACHREVLDERGRGDAERVESVLDGTVSDGHGQVRFPSPRLAR